MLLDAAERSDWNVPARMWDGHRAGFRRVSELIVRSLHPIEYPTAVLEQPDDLARAHRRLIIQHIRCIVKKTTQVVQVQRRLCRERESGDGAGQDYIAFRQEGTKGRKQRGGEVKQAPRNAASARGSAPC